MNLLIPKHIAIIMDGNRRWAREHGLPAVAGHQKVVNGVLEPLIEHAAKLGISYVTLWAFSTDNWQRDQKEVAGIMNIFRSAIKKFGEKMHKKGICIKIIGDLSRFDDDLQKSVIDLIELTKNNTRITVVFALNYGGRDEIIRAINRMAENNVICDMKYVKRKTNGDVSRVTSHVSPDILNSYLDTFGIPDPELIIRTGGEQRTSGFLLWQSQYSEWWFPTWYMPEFTPEKLDEAIAEYNFRQRRFGK